MFLEHIADNHINYDYRILCLKSILVKKSEQVRAAMAFKPWINYLKSMRL